MVHSQNLKSAWGDEIYCRYSLLGKSEIGWSADDIKLIGSTTESKGVVFILLQHFANTCFITQYFTKNLNRLVLTYHPQMRDLAVVFQPQWNSCPSWHTCASDCSLPLFCHSCLAPSSWLSAATQHPAEYPCTKNYKRQQRNLNELKINCDCFFCYVSQGVTAKQCEAAERRRELIKYQFNSKAFLIEKSILWPIIIHLNDIYNMYK